MKGNPLKRYIYAGLGALALTGAGFAVAVTMSPPSDVATAVIEANKAPSASASATPTPSASPQATGTPNETPKPSEEPTKPPAIPVEQRDPNDTSPVDSGNPIFNQKANPQETVNLSPSQEVKTRADGSTYFVEVGTGKEISDTTTGNITNPVQDPYAKPLDAPGAGSKEDKTNAATSLMNYLNAIHDEDFNKACSYVSVEGLTPAQCLTALEKRTAKSPLKSSYTINNVDPIDIQGDTARLSPLAVKNADGEGTATMLAKKSATNASIWLIADNSLLAFK